jgi:hypothetical protein
MDLHEEEKKDATKQETAILDEDAFIPDLSSPVNLFDWQPPQLK